MRTLLGNLSSFRRPLFTVAAAFNPLSLSPYLILDPTTISGSDGDDLSSLPDSSGNGRNAASYLGTGIVTLVRPKLKKSIVNGNDVVRWVSGGNSAFSLVDLSAFTAGHIFVVLKIPTYPPASGSDGQFMEFSGNSSYYTFSDGLIYDDFGSTTRRNAITPNTAPSSWSVYEVESGAGVWTNRQDGVQLYTTATNTVSFSTSPLIGTAGSNVFFLGDIAYLILFNSRLSSPNAASMRGYLKTRFSTP